MHGIEKGYILKDLPPPPSFCELIKNENWAKLDQQCHELTKAPNGEIFILLNQLTPITSIEFIISLRVAGENEEGIWHDDGSRKIAFSWSLTLPEFSPEGGILSIRNKQNPNESSQLPTPEYGKIIIFKTGLDDWEHKISEVTNGRRLIIAGWGQ